MKVLLFGASGQLGKEWQHVMAHHGNEHLLIPYTSGQLDITHQKDVRHELEEEQPDVIVNCAAYTQVDKAEEEADKAFEVNAVAVKNLARACEERDIKLVHFSTDYIFAGKKKDRFRFPEGYPEHHEADPINTYGETKWQGEQGIREAGDNHLIIRVSWLCGAHGGNFVKTMLKLADTRDRLQIVDDQIASPTYTHLLVENTLKLIQKSFTGTYHYTSGGIISWADFAEAIFSIADKNVDIERVPSSEYRTKAKRPFYSKLSTQKIANVEGCNIIDWKEGLNMLLKQIEHSG